MTVKRNLLDMVYSIGIFNNRRVTTCASVITLGIFSEDGFKI
ncbi:MAG: hypothetical protein ACFFEF_15400 [Candidatus Thorarchaeota archaeon]